MQEQNKDTKEKDLTQQEVRKRRHVSWSLPLRVDSTRIPTRQPAGTFTYDASLDALCRLIKVIPEPMPPNNEPLLRASRVVVLCNDDDQLSHTAIYPRSTVYWVVPQKSGPQSAMQRHFLKGPASRCHHGVFGP